MRRSFIIIIAPLTGEGRGKRGTKTEHFKAVHVFWTAVPQDEDNPSRFTLGTCHLRDAELVSSSLWALSTDRVPAAASSLDPAAGSVR